MNTPASEAEAQSSAESAPPTRPGAGTPDPRRAPLAWALHQLPIALPPLVWLVLGWQRRWITDDGLIAARTVRQILAGNGPVFNAGERVEANTSTLWTWLLALISGVTRLDVYPVMVWTGLILAPLGLLFALLGARELHRRHAPGAPFLPVGAAVILALPPFWDFVTSGLEDSLVFCWLGLCWWLLAGLEPGPGSRRRAAWLAFVAGLGWLVRPDMAIGTVVFLAALWYLVRPKPRHSALLLLAAGALPVAYQVFRMGYYGLLTPNTAVAKDASQPHVRQGLTYLMNFVSPYRLWMPALLLLALGVLVLRGRFERADLVRTAAPLLAGLLMAGYVVAIGGDFMHARMLLPAAFTLLLPVMGLPVPSPRAARVAAGRRSIAVGAGFVLMAVWALMCGIDFRVSQLPWAIPANGIVDERTFWVDATHQPNPVTPDGYVLALMGSVQDRGSTEWMITEDLASGKPMLLYPVDSTHTASVPLDKPGAPIAVTALVLGTAGAAVPLDALVIDQHGLSYALGAHLTGIPGGRVGHDKTADPVWIIAEYSDATHVPGIPDDELAAARRALGCGRLAELRQATEGSLTFGRFWSNVLRSPKLTSMRIADDPVTAARHLCG